MEAYIGKNTENNMETNLGSKGVEDTVARKTYYLPRIHMMVIEFILGSLNPKP